MYIFQNFPGVTPPDPLLVQGFKFRPLPSKIMAARLLVTSAWQPVSCLVLDCSHVFIRLTTAVERDPTNVVISSDGSILWVPPVTYRNLCDSNANGELKCDYK